MSSKLGGVIIAAAAALGGATIASAVQENGGEQLFRDVLSVISSRYVDQIEANQLLEKAAYGLIEQLDDPYAEIYSPKELDEFSARHQGNYGGVGMTIEMRDGVPTVTRVFPDTPAERAAMMEGDELMAVNAEPVLDWQIEKVTDRIKGEPGSKVTIDVRRAGHTNKVTMARAIVKIPAVAYSARFEDFGYIPLQQFGETSAEEVLKAANELRQQGVKGFVLDLRGNGGGLLDQAVEIADVFLPAGDTVVLQRERGQAQRGQVLGPNKSCAAGYCTQAWLADDAERMNDLPLVILVDEASASASEVLAGALQDHDRALVIGMGTYGKGVVQSVYRVGDGSLLKLTTGEWLTPAGRSIHRKREKVNNRWVLSTDSTNYKDFKSVGGRALHGGGGIEPDLVVRPDTLNTLEQQFVKTIQPKSQEFYLAYTGLAAELKAQVKPGFTVQQAWLDELYTRMQARKIEVSREQYDNARQYVSDLLAFRIARQAFGDAEAKRMFIRQDLPLSRALELLAAHRTQKDLLASVND